MIISHDHKFIFIKTRKTAGTSIEIALSKFCGEKDIITPMLPEDEQIRSRLGYRGAQNYSIPFYKLIRRCFFYYWIYFIRRGKCLSFYNHIPAFKIRKILNPYKWDSYYKFCFERNPWDKVISWYYWYYYERKVDPLPPISEFINLGKSDLVSNFSLYTIDDKIVVDKVCLYENLEQEKSPCSRCF